MFIKEDICNAQTYNTYNNNNNILERITPIDLAPNYAKLVL